MKVSYSIFVFACVLFVSGSVSAVVLPNKERAIDLNRVSKREKGLEDGDHDDGAKKRPV